MLSQGGFGRNASSSFFESFGIRLLEVSDPGVLSLVHRSSVMQIR